MGFRDRSLSDLNTTADHSKHHQRHQDQRTPLVLRTQGIPLVSSLPSSPLNPSISHQNHNLTDCRRIPRLHQSLEFQGIVNLIVLGITNFDRLGHKHAPRSNPFGATRLNPSQLRKRQHLIQSLNLIKTLLCSLNNRSLYFMPTAKIRRI
jgi:hypothetical protein